MKRAMTVCLFLCLLLPFCAAARAEEGESDGDAIYQMLDETGSVVMTRAGKIYEGDEYISADNQLYRVVYVDEGRMQATATHVGEEPPVNADLARAVYASAEEGKRLIGMYSTHSDESYEPTDGSSSLKQNAGIYDVGAALKEELEGMGIEVELDETSHLPHDTKAYSRSRRTAEELLKKSPDALLDIHRDGIPDESEYETEVEGEDMSKVRLLVGRSNPNSSANREFAKQLKAAADKQYPGLIKDIFVGKGNYNQELYPKSILLEFGTHTIDKESVVKSTPYMAEVLASVLYGSGSAKAEGSGGKEAVQESKAGGHGMIWVIAVLVLAAGVYALIATGSLKGMAHKLKRGMSEVSGGALGRKRK